MPEDADNQLPAVPQFEPQPNPPMSQLSAMLAFDIASELRTPDELMAAYSLTESEFRALLSNDIFRGMVKEARARWKTDMNAGERIKAKAQVALEDVLQEAHTIASNQDIGPSVRLDALKTLHEFAGMKGQVKPEGEGRPADRFAININIGGEKVTIAPALPT